jgi:signal transduction histidine kinase
MLMVLGDVVIRRDFGLLGAVAVAILLSWVGGIWSGLTATLLLAMVFAGPAGTDHVDPPVDNLSLFLFVASGLIGTGVLESQHRARWRAEAARDRARESRRAEHAIRAELESIVAAIGEGIVVSDHRGSVSLMNQAAADLVGGRVEHFADIAEAFASEEEGLTPTQLLASDGSSEGEFLLNADSRRVAMKTFPLRGEGMADRRILLLRDVTEERRRERLREAFLSLLSHELRTPMTAVYGGATLMQRIGDRLDAKTRQEIRADIVFEADRLSRLIDDLLVLTRLESGSEVGHEPALLQHLVADVVAHDSPTPSRSSIELSIEPGLPPVMGDETSIRQVTHNLLSNAMKYGPAGSVIEVRVEALAERRGSGDGTTTGDGQDGDQPSDMTPAGEAAAGEVAVRVLDRGPGLGGFDAEVFDLFYRGAAADGVTPGLGIGLFVCSRLVEAMGGRVWTRPREGGGSEFGFALNVWPLEEEIDEDVEPQASESGRELVVAEPSPGPRW